MAVGFSGILIRDIALIRLLILTSQTRCVRCGDKFVPRENNWQQLGFVRVASISFLSRSRLSSSARRCVLIPHPPCSPILGRHGPGDFVNASMHMYFMAGPSRSAGIACAAVTGDARRGYFRRINSF